MATDQLRERNSPPRIVESTSIFTIRTMSCQRTYSCLCTGGGYVYFFGVLTEQAAKQNSIEGCNLPYTLPDLEQYFIVDIACSKGLIALLVDTGDVYIVNETLELVKLPSEAVTLFKSIGIYRNTIYGISQKKTLFEWKMNEAAVREWKEYFLNESCIRPVMLKGCDLPSVLFEHELGDLSVLAICPKMNESFGSICEHRSHLNVLQKINLKNVRRHRMEYEHKTRIAKGFRALLVSSVKSVFEELRDWTSKKKLIVTQRASNHLIRMSQKNLLLQGWEHWVKYYQRERSKEHKDLYFKRTVLCGLHHRVLIVKKLTKLGGISKRQLKSIFSQWRDIARIQSCFMTIISAEKEVLLSHSLSRILNYSKIKNL